MQNSLILQDKNYISAKQVQDLFGYASDYVGQLCRAGKLEAKMIGRSWYVAEKSIIDYKTSITEFMKQKNSQKKSNSKRLYNSPQKFQKKFDKKIEERKISFKDFIVEEPKIISPYVPLKIEIEHKDFIPVLKKKVLNIHKIHNPVRRPALEVGVIENFSNPSNSLAVKSPFALDRSEKNKFIFATVAAVVVMIFFIYGSVRPINKSAVNSMPASVASGFSEIIRSVSGGFRNFAMGLLGKSSQLSVAPTEEKGDGSGVNFNSIAVVPSTHSASKDEIVKEKIRESFSDEIRVSPDRSGTAGIITPVFKKATGDDFVYVLVPINPEVKTERK